MSVYPKYISAVDLCELRTNTLRSFKILGKGDGSSSPFVAAPHIRLVEVEVSTSAAVLVPVSRVLKCGIFWSPVAQFR